MLFGCTKKDERACLPARTPRLLPRKRDGREEGEDNAVARCPGVAESATMRSRGSGPWPDRSSPQMRRYINSPGPFPRRGRNSALLDRRTEGWMSLARPCHGLQEVRMCGMGREAL